MENLLQSYLEKKFRDSTEIPGKGGGPIVTISREYGCPSKEVARMLAKRLNDRPGEMTRKRWKCISRELVEQAAQELNLDPQKVRSILYLDYKGDIDDILSSFSQNYKSNRRVRKTIADLIRSFAEKGHVIFVGRGSVALTRNYPNSLHIRLQAPLEWRVGDVASRHGIPEAEALKRITRFDRNRTDLIELFLGQTYSGTLFDLIYNCMTLSKEEIAGSVIQMMEQRRMI